MSKVEEYIICQKRGHTPDVMAGMAINATHNALAWQTCKYCGTQYTRRTTSELLERNTPTNLNDKE